jgi:hypothetical protein
VKRFTISTVKPKKHMLCELEAIVNGAVPTAESWRDDSVD